MVKFTFKPFKSQKSPTTESPPDDGPQSSYQRRREQVRRAQKTHRERKEAYIKSLETEVIQLRANEARLFQETKTLYAEINAMKILLANNGIPIPSGQPTSLPPQEHAHIEQDDFFNFSIPKKTSKQQQERIHVRRQTPYRGDHVLDTKAGYTGVSSPDEPPPAPTPYETIYSSPTEAIVCQQDVTAIGMDFILSLEAPCLGHIPATLDHEAPSGHALMASATLLHHHHLTGADRTQVPNPTWNVPEAGVERLLDLSSNIPLDGEVTPVQAWDYIRQHPRYETLDCARLEKLKARLIVQIKCYGFGGTIPQDVFENAVFDMYVVGQVF